MRLKMRFGLSEPDRDVNWWRELDQFPNLVIFKGKKWEFIFYDEDDTGKVDYICMFAEVQTYDPNYHATIYEPIDYLFDFGNNECECGSKYDKHSPEGHMFFCRLWRRS